LEKPEVQTKIKEEVSKQVVNAAQAALAGVFGGKKAEEPESNPSELIELGQSAGPSDLALSTYVDPYAGDKVA